tara:strand:- start:260 stop:568 length:309 start_codon:yes stop_codon:yes gene_type:complete
MKIEKAGGDLILLVLNDHESLKKIGINKDKFFNKRECYNENGMWIHHPEFMFHNLRNEDKEKTKKIVASILTPWAFIVSITHFPDAEGFDFLSPFEQHIGFN